MDEQNKNTNIADDRAKQDIGNAAQGTKNTAQHVSNGAKKIKGAVGGIGDKVENTGRNMKKAGKGVELAGKGTQTTGKSAQIAGKGLQTASKAAPAAGAGLGAAAGGVIGSIVPGAGTAAGAAAGAKIGQGIGKGVGVAGEAAGKGLEAGGKVAETGGKGLEKAGKGLQSAGDKTEKAGKGINKAAKGITKAVMPAAGTIAGAGVGALAGTLLLPGVGTVIGGAVGGAIGNAAGRIGALTAGSLLDLLTNPLEKVRGIFSLQKIKEKIKKLLKSPKFWIILLLIFFIMSVFFTIEILKKKAYEFVGEFVESLKQNIGNLVYAKGYGTFGALTQDEFDRVTKGVKEGKLEEGSTIAKSEIPFFGMNAKRMGGSISSPDSLQSYLPNSKLDYAYNSSENALNISRKFNVNYYNSGFSLNKPVYNSIKQAGLMTSGFGRYGKFNNLMSPSIAVYAAEAESLDYNRKLDQVCTDEERDRIIYYLERERNSIIKAPVEEKTALDLSIKGIFNSFLDIFFGRDNDDESQRDYGSGKNKIKYPRLTFKNAEGDFDKNGKLNELKRFVEDTIIQDNEGRVGGSFGLPEDMYEFYPGNKMKNQINNINDFIKTKPDNDKPPPMMQITEKTVEDGETKDMEMDDALYRIIEPYALDWKFLYTIDKAIDEDVFNNLGDLKKTENITEEDKEKIKKQLHDKFMYVDIPKFMPQFKVVRHVVRDYNYSWQLVHSCSEDDEGDIECNNTYPEDTNYKRDVFTPDYKLEWIDILTKDQFMPTCQVLTFEYNEVKTKPSDLGSYTWTKTLTMKSRPEYYKESMGRGDDNYISGSPIIKNNGGDDDINRTIKFEKIVWYPEKDPKRYTKRDDIRKLFENDYGLHLYDIRHVLYLMDGNTYFPTARVCIAWIYGMNLKYISNKNNYYNGGAGAGANGDGWIADLTYLWNDPSTKDRNIVKQIFTQDNINWINRNAPPKGIPASAWVAQMIEEASWDLSPVARDDYNLSGVKGSPHGHLSPEGDYYKHFQNYQEYFKYYVDKLLRQPNFMPATAAARNGWTRQSTVPLDGINQSMINAARAPGPEAYLFSLQDRTSMAYAGGGFSYSQRVITLLWENQLKGSGTSGAGAGNGASGLGETIIKIAESQLGRPYEWGGKYGELGSPPNGKGLDCSGFVQWVMINAMGNKDPFSAYRSTIALHKAIDDGVLEVIDYNDIQPGDIFIRSGRNEVHDSNDHTGFYWGMENGKKMIIHEPGTGEVCKKAEMTETYRTWCRVKGAGSYSRLGGNYIGVDIFNLPDSYYDSSKDKEVDEQYDGGPDPWGEDFAGSSMIGYGNGGTSLGPDEVSAQGFSWPIPDGIQLLPFKRGWKYGPRDSGFHTGLDMTPVNGVSVPVYAAKGGRIIKVRDKGNTSYGKYVEIEHDGGVTTLYAHLRKNTYFREGDTVTQGQQIGDMGSTGHSTGTHLHFEVRVLGKHTDPEKYLPPRQ